LHHVIPLIDKQESLSVCISVLEVSLDRYAPSSTCVEDSIVDSIVAGSATSLAITSIAIIGTALTGEKNSVGIIPQRTSC